MNTRFWILGAIALALPLAAQQSPRPAVHYKIVQLATLGGSSNQSNSLNNRDWAAGAASLPPANTTIHATLWVFGRALDLGTLGGPNSAVLWPVKDTRGLLAGVSETAAMNPLGEAWSCSAFFPTVTGHVCVGFVWRDGVMRALPTLGGYDGFATGVNNRGQVVGWSETAVHDPTCVAPQVLQFEATEWGPRQGQIRELPPLAGDADGAATAINDRGEAVGISGACDVAVGALSAEHMVLWRHGVASQIPGLGGKGWNTAMAINQRGEVAGFSDLPGDYTGGVLTPNFHAFAWTRKGGTVDLKTLPGDTISEATGINNRGQIVGLSGARAVIWENGKILDLNTLIPANTGLYLSYANDINDQGVITGGACVPIQGACTSQSETVGFLAIPVRSHRP